ncbi:MAG: hypothetical protein FWD89_04350 [Firmicutes bacterium]|nr:hypothetical protein [Bacillota bacterium]MCL2771513.1 hypothetical protein [Bacillota bacterium]
MATPGIINLVKYQQEDAKLFKIEREIETNKFRVQAAKDAEDFKQTQETAKKLEQAAGMAIEKFNSVKADYEKNYEKAKELTALDIDKLTDEQIIKVNNELDVILANLTKIEKELLELNTNVEEILARFEASKKKAITARTSYQQNKEAYEKFLAEAQAQAKVVAETLKGLQAGQDKALLTKYMAKRKEKVFPVIVAIKGDSCSACAAQISTVCQNKIKTDGYAECENCLRILIAK